MSSDVCGYVVDLRGNTGGDMFPMVVGLFDLIGEGHLMRFVHPDGSGTSILFADGAVHGLLDDGEQILLDRVEGWTPDPEAASRPVALLIDDATASSGEGAALALIGREGVRTFGGRTAGRASANQMVRLSDGTRLFITVSMMTDRRGRTYPDGVAPDEAIASGGPDDAVEQAGRAWLTRQPACAAA
jgi:carboxyl-terminal processing protease